MSTNYPPHAAGAPSRIRALLLLAANLDPDKAYAITAAGGRWVVAELEVSDLPAHALRGTDALVVECGANLETALPGATTTITKLEANT